MLAHDLNLRHLRAFVEVCRSGSVSTAAGRVFMSQPAVSQAVAKLESGLGFRLLTRGGRGMYPTDAGKLFLNRCERALSILQEGGRNARRRQREGASENFVEVVTSRQLRALIAVAQHGNYSIAARALGIAQPSLYRMARDLEDYTKLTLYSRSRQGIDLTPSGKALYRAAMLAFSELDRGIEEVSAAHGLEVASISIGSLPLARSTILSDALNALSEKYPMVRIDVIDSPYKDLLFALRHGEIDLIIGALRAPDPAPDVVQKALFDDRLGIYCRAGHPLLGIAHPRPSDLLRYPWVISRAGTPTRAYFDGYFNAHDLAAPQMITETGSLILVRRLLAGSDRLTMLSQNQAREDVDRGDLCRLQLPLDDKPRPIGITVRKGWSPTAIQSHLLEQLGQAAEPYGRTTSEI